MPVESQIPTDHPLLKAWEEYKLTDDYANTRKWASHVEHVEGSLWAAFVKGWYSKTDLNHDSCNHIVAYANEEDAVPCPVCERNRLYEAMRHASTNNYPPSGIGWATCRGCGCITGGPDGELVGEMKIEHKQTCPFRFWLDERGRVCFRRKGVMPT